MNRQYACRKGITETIGNEIDAGELAKSRPDNILKFLISVAKKSILLGTVAILPLAFAQSASAQLVFTADDAVGSTGDWTLGSSFGSWDMTYTSGGSAITPNNFTVNDSSLGYIFNEGSTGWGLEQIFTITPDPASSPDSLFKMVLEGNAGYTSTSTPSGNFGSKFSSYGIALSTAGDGDFGFSDPDNQLFNADASTGTWVQRNADDVVGLPADCNVNGAAIRNRCLTWSVASPEFGGAETDMTLNAGGGAAKEGFAFSLSSIANIEVAKSVSLTAPVEHGDQGYFDIVVSANSNAGAFSNATNVALMDILPAGAVLDLTQGGGDGWEVFHSGGGTTTQDGGSYNTTTGLWDIGTVAIGGSTTLRLHFTADASAGLSTVTNTIDPVTISLDQDEADVLAGNPITIASIEASFDVILPAPAMTLAKVADNATDRKPGETITYTYTAVNTGNVAINDVTVTDVHNGTGTLSAISINALTNTSGNSSDDGADNDIDVLAPNDSVAFEATYVVTDADIVAGTDITNTATVTGDPVGGALPSTPITADETVTVAPLSADLSITKTNTPGVNNEVDQAADTLTFGDSTTYTVIITNNGPDSFIGAVATDTVGAGLNCAAADTVTITGSGVPSGSFTIGDLTGAGITLENLADGEAATLTYTCEVN